MIKNNIYNFYPILLLLKLRSHTFYHVLRIVMITIAFLTLTPKSILSIENVSFRQKQVQSGIGNGIG